jgi:class 3 adenylate cyclase
VALSPETRFCISCGATVEGEGDEAGAATRSLHRHMPKQYVDQLLASRGRVTGERRVITMLFCDVKGSTAMAEKLDPEEVMEIMNGAFEVLSEPVYRYEGTLARLMGDALLCFFGAPITHEDDPVRACRCALDVLAAAKGYAKRLEMERGIPDFNVRVGINTGLVVVGEVGADLRVEYTAMGDAVNLAARMESAAETGTILISEHTHRLIHTAFETESLGSMQLKGRSEPVRVFRVLRFLGGTGTTRGIEGLHSALIGRDGELQQVESALHDLVQGSGGAVAVIGEAGLGKSRLVREARRSCPYPIAWVEGRCLPYTTGMSYWMAKDLLHQLIGVDAETPASEVGVALRQGLGGDGYPYLAHLLGAPLDDEVAERIRKLEPEDLQQRIWQAYRGAIRLRAGERPLVLVLEDLHWVDPSSLKLLDGLLSLTGEMALLIFLIFRREDGPVWDLHRRLEDGDRPYRVLQLAPLSRDESNRLLQNLLHVEGMPDHLQTLILDRAEGNAFYLEEVLRSLLEEGAITLHGTAAVFSERVSPIDVPESLTGVIMARIDRLPPTEKRILQTASVLGRTFLQSVMRRLLEAETEEGELDGALAELRRREFLLLPGDEVAPAPSAGVDSSQTLEIRRAGP